MNSAKEKIPLENYIEWIKEDGIGVIDKARANSHWLGESLKSYSETEVMQQLEPYLPALIEKNCKEGMGNRSDDKMRSNYENFFQRYREGKEVIMNNIKIKKPEEVKPPVQ